MTDPADATSATIVRAIAEREGVTATDLDPLYGAVEPGALDRLCDHGFEGTLAFRYQGYRITVAGDGTVSISE